jgi:hypothetical protein
VARKAGIDGEGILQSTNRGEVITMRTIYVIVAATLSLSACQIGANAAKFEVARNPEGAVVQLTTAAGKFDAELLEVRDSGIVVLRKDGRVAFAPWKSTRFVSVRNIKMTVGYGGGGPPSRDARTIMVLVSHFPQGMSAEIEKQVLASRGQAEMVVIE